MNESEKGTKGPSAWLLIGLIVVLVIGVQAIFTLIEKVGPERHKDPYEVMDVTKGVPSPWKLEIGPAPAESGAAQWLAQCKGAGGCHTFLDVGETEADWSAWVYLPGVKEKLTNAQAGVQLLSDEHGDTLMVYHSTEGVTETVQPQDQLLRFVAPEGHSVNQVQVSLNGRVLDRISMCILNSGQMFWAAGDGGPLEAED